MQHDQTHPEMCPVFNEDGMFAHWECRPCGYRYGKDNDRVNSVVISSD